MKKNPVLYNSFAVGVIVLFIGMSVVSSTIAEDKSSNNYFLESANNPKKPLPCDHSAYVIGDGPDCYLYEFILTNASDLNCVCDGSSEYIRHATWSSDNYIYFTQYSSGFLYVIDIDSCELLFIGGGGYSLSGGLAYDLTTNRMFGVLNTGFDEYLVEVDPATGEQELIVSLGYSIYPTVGIAFDSEGKLYGWSWGNNKLWTIDFETWNVTIVGDLGFNINYSYTCDGDFCKKDDILYIAHENKLYMYDLDKGQCELIDEFPDYVSVTALAIPYDIIPPVTTHTLDPPEPDGNNGWYVSDVTVTLNATDDLSGVNVTYYRIRWGDWVLYTEPFTLSYDVDDILIEYYSVDFAGNVETKNNFYVSLDGTVPEVCMTYEMDYDTNLGWICLYYTIAIDRTSGMDYVEFYRDGELKETVYGPGPCYEWIWEYSNVTHIKGLIRNRKISEDKVEFKALIIKTEESMGKITHLTCGYDKAGNKACDAVLTPPPPGPLYWILLLKRVTLPNNYTGYVGRFLISATFNTN